MSACILSEHLVGNIKLKELSFYGNLGIIDASLPWISDMII